MKKRWFGVLLLVAACLSSVNGATPLREFRGTWIATVGNIDWPKAETFIMDDSTRVATQKQAFITILDRMQEANLNVAFLQVRPMADALYSSQLVPWSYYIAGSRGYTSPGYDPLLFAIAECHRRGIELHAWMNPYRYENGNAQHLRSDYLYANHPDWLLKRGSNTILNPGLPAVRTHIAEVTAELVRNYPELDGVVWDDYFYYSDIQQEDSAAYRLYNPNSLSKSDWRRDNVNKTVAQVHDSIKSISPYTRFGISPRGIWSVSQAAAAHYGVTLPSGITGSDNYNTIYCDALAWMSAGDIDYISPQLYWPSYQTGQDYRKLAPWWQQMADTFGVDFYSSQALYRGYSMSEIGLEIDVNRQCDADRTPGSVFYNTSCFMADSVTPYLKAHYFKTKFLTPAIDDHGLGTHAVLSNVYYNADSTQISWTSSTNQGSYALYLVPQNPRGNLYSTMTFFIDRTWDTLYDVSAYKQQLGAFCFTVVPVNRYVELGAPMAVNGMPLPVVTPVELCPLYYTTAEGLHVDLDVPAVIAVYGVDGYCWYRGYQLNSFDIALPRGIYILRIENQCYKFVK